MEEKIIEIMAQNITHLRMVQACETSVKITSHVMEFIEWKDFSKKTYVDRENKKYVVFIEGRDDNSKEIAVNMTLNELYQYWLKNVKDESV
jgi:hypothetical protein